VLTVCITIKRNYYFKTSVPKELQRDNRKANTNKAKASTSKVSFATRESNIDLKDDARSQLGSVAEDKVSQLGPIATQDAASLSGGWQRKSQLERESSHCPRPSSRGRQKRQVTMPVWQPCNSRLQPQD
jgi:ATPase subunit of ABC transporter with duplicated ATPase domains